jgi:hypothetical protein
VTLLIDADRAAVTVQRGLRRRRRDDRAASRRIGDTGLRQRLGDMHQPLLVGGLAMPVRHMDRGGEDEIAGLERGIERAGNPEAHEPGGTLAQQCLGAPLGGIGIATGGDDRDAGAAQQPRLAGHAGHGPDRHRAGSCTGARAGSTTAASTPPIPASSWGGGGSRANSAPRWGGKLGLIAAGKLPVSLKGRSSATNI